jgi:hypothetical protein
MAHALQVMLQDDAGLSSIARTSETETGPDLIYSAAGPDAENSLPCMGPYWDLSVLSFQPPRCVLEIRMFPFGSQFSLFYCAVTPASLEGPCIKEGGRRTTPLAQRSFIDRLPSAFVA